MYMQPEGDVLTELREAVAKYRSLAKTNSEAMLVFAAAWADLGAMLAKQGYTVEGIEAMHHAVETYGTLADQHTDRDEFLERWASGLTQLAKLSMEAGRTDEALECREQALRIERTRKNRES